MTDKADNDALVERLEWLVPQMADPDWLRSEELPATASLVSMLPAILAALRTPQPGETETLRAEVERLRELVRAASKWIGKKQHSKEGQALFERLSQALKGTDHGRG